MFLHSLNYQNLIFSFQLSESIRVSSHRTAHTEACSEGEPSRTSALTGDTRPAHEQAEDQQGCHSRREAAAPGE